MSSNWMDDILLEERMVQLNLTTMRRCEMLDFLKKEFPHYPWSGRTLRRRLQYFNLKKCVYTNEDVQMAEVYLRKELDGPGTY